MHLMLSYMLKNVSDIIDILFCRTTGSPQAKSPAGSSAGALPPEARTPTAPNKALQNVKGDHPSVSQQDVSMVFVY